MWGVYLGPWFLVEVMAALPLPFFPRKNDRLLFFREQGSGFLFFFFRCFFPTLFCLLCRNTWNLPLVENRANIFRGGPLGRFSDPLNFSLLHTFNGVHFFFFFFFPWRVAPFPKNPISPQSSKGSPGLCT